MQSDVKYNTQTILDRMSSVGCCVDLNIKTWNGKLNLSSISNNEDILADLKDISKNDYLQLLDNSYIKKFKKYEMDARLWLEYNSYPFLFGKFVPNKALDILMGGNADKDGLTNIKHDFYYDISSLLENLNDIRESILTHIPDKYKDSIEWEFPSKSQIINKFDFNWICYNINVNNIYDTVYIDTYLENYLPYALDYIKFRLLNKIRNFLSLLNSDTIRIVKSSSVIALKKAIENFKTLNYFNYPNLIENLDNIYNDISSITNIPKDSVDQRINIGAKLERCLHILEDNKSEIIINNFLNGEKSDSIIT